MVHLVPSSLAADLWPAIETFAAGAMEFHPFMDMDDLRTLLVNGAGQLFICMGEGRKVQGFAIMEVVQYPRRRVANILACGGEDGFTSVAVHDLLPHLKQWAHEHHADTLAILGARPGWLKLLQSEGGNAMKFAMWWAELGDVQGRRQLEESATNGRVPAVGQGATVPH